MSQKKKKNVKVIEDDIYGKRLEIYEGTEKVVESVPFSWNYILILEETIPFSGSHFFQWRPLLLVKTIPFNGGHFI